MEILLICKYKDCNKYLIQPVALPCGNNVCKTHIDELIKEGVSYITCNFYCEEVEHLIPIDGFKINKLFVDVLNKSLHLNEAEKKIQKIINEMKANFYEFNLVANDPDNFINDYVSNVINEIDLERERLLLEKSSFMDNIYLISDEMISKLKEFESECMRNLIKLDLLHENYKEWICCISAKLQIFSSRLRIPNKSTTMLSMLLEDTNISWNDVEDKLVDLKDQLLIGKGCAFSPKDNLFDERLFGDLKIDESIGIKTLASTKKYGLFSSHILTTDQAHNLLRLCEFEIDCKFKLIYRASDDGFKAEDFHRKCDGVARTLTIIKVKDNLNVFGGFTELSWDSSGKTKTDSKTFIFSLINRDDEPIKLKPIRNNYSINCDPSSGPIFGRGHDIHISNESNSDNTSYSYLGCSYKHPHYASGSIHAQNFLAGSYRFVTQEIEIYQKII